MRSRAGVLLVLPLVLGAGCRAAERPGVVLFPDMYQSVPYDPYDASSLTRNGQASLAPPDGTIAMQAQVFSYGATPEEARRAGRELRNPALPTSENLARGKKVFDTVCFVCHGPGGEGDGPIIGRFPNPPSLLAERAKALPDGQIYHIVTRGQGIMPAHAPQVLPADRWRVVLYLRQLQGPAAAPRVAPAGGSD